MAVSINWENYELQIKAASIEARGADSIDEALDIQAAGYRDALEVVFTEFLATALVNGGLCVDNGPITGAIIS